MSNRKGKNTAKRNVNQNDGPGTKRDQDETIAQLRSDLAKKDAEKKAALDRLKDQHNIALKQKDEKFQRDLKKEVDAKEKFRSETIKLKEVISQKNVQIGTLTTQLSAEQAEVLELQTKLVLINSTNEDSTSPSTSAPLLPTPPAREAGNPWKAKTNNSPNNNNKPNNDSGTTSPDADEVKISKAQYHELLQVKLTDIAHEVERLRLGEIAHQETKNFITELERNQENKTGLSDQTKTLALELQKFFQENQMLNQGRNFFGEDGTMMTDLLFLIKYVLMMTGGETCGICFCEYGKRNQDGLDIVKKVLDCGHCLCYVCWDDWQNTNDSKNTSTGCPMCRRKYVDTETYPVLQTQISGPVIGKKTTPVKNKRR